MDEEETINNASMHPNADGFSNQIHERTIEDHFINVEPIQESEATIDQGMGSVNEIVNVPISNDSSLHAASMDNCITNNRAVSDNATEKLVNHSSKFEMSDHIQSTNIDSLPANSDDRFIPVESIQENEKDQFKNVGAIDSKSHDGFDNVGSKRVIEDDGSIGAVVSPRVTNSNDHHPNSTGSSCSNDKCDRLVKRTETPCANASVVSKVKTVNDNAECKPIECGVCGNKNVTMLLSCETCEEMSMSCVSCDTLKHQHIRRALHKRVRKFGGTYDVFLTEKLEAFRRLAVGASPVQIESVEFVVCAEKSFSVEKLEQAYKNCSEGKSLIRYLLAEVRDLCHLKRQFDRVLAQAPIGLGAIDFANANDFVICLLDACKQRWQQNNIAESLMQFDYPIVLGHNSCSMNNNNNPKVYGLHLGELYHLLNCVDDESSENKFVNVLSIGTRGTRNKTTFLNEIWKTKFEKWTENRGLYHNGLLELHVGDEKNKRKQHLIDLHGNKYEPVLLQMLCTAADLLIVHCLAVDIDLILKEINDELTNLLPFMADNHHVLLVVQGLSSNSFATMFDAEQAIFSIIRPKLLNVHVLALSSLWQEVQNVSAVHSRVSEVLTKIQQRKQPLKRLHKALQHVVFATNDFHANHVPQSFETLRMNIRHVLCESEQRGLNWFPLNKNSNILASLDNEQYESAKYRDEIKIQQEGIKSSRSDLISKPVQLFRDQIAAPKSDLDAAATAFSIFQQELNRKFQQSIDHERKVLKSCKDKLAKNPNADETRKQLKNTVEKLVSFDIACVHFIRELIERGNDGNDDVAKEAAVFVCQNELLMGRSIEVVNGDTLWITSDFLQQVLHPIFLAFNSIKDVQSYKSETNNSESNIMKLVNYFTAIVRATISGIEQSPEKELKQTKFVSITVIGVESSGKSTLWNELWNTNFPVAHGKCSRGLWSAFVHAQDGPSLLVNDTEGIMSPICNKPRFDQKLVLLAFAMSHIVIINIRGEGSKELIDLLKLIIYAAHKLSVFHKPQIVFVHRDVTGVKLHEQGAFKNIIISQLHEACAAMSRESETGEIKLEKIIDINNVHSIDLPSAINEPPLDLAGVSTNREERTEEFVLKCRELRRILIELSKDILKDKSKQFPSSLDGKDGWIDRLQIVWDLAKQNASLWTYTSVNDMIQRRYIEKEVYLLFEKSLQEMNAAALGQIDNIMDENNPNRSTSLISFPGFLEHLKRKLVEKLEKEINEVVAAFTGPTISQSVTIEYKEKVKRDLENRIEEKKDLLAQKQKQRRLQKNIDVKVAELQEKMDALKDKNLSKEEIENLFDSYLKEGMETYEEARNQRDITSEQMNAVDQYISLGNVVPHHFQREFINLWLCDPQFLNTANQMKVAYSKNVSDQFPIDVAIASNTSGVKRPSWSFESLRAFKKVSTRTVAALYDIQDFVYRFLWIKCKSSDNYNSSDWTKTVKELCNGVDSHFVNQLPTLNMLDKITNPGSSFHQTGYIATVTNLYHAFACNMLYFFIAFKNELDVNEEIRKFREDGSKKKHEFVLRAQTAKNAEDAAMGTARLIFASVSDHVHKQAVDQVVETLRKWSVEPKTLVNEAMETTFRSENYDGAYEFILNPLGFLKDLCKNRFNLESKKVRARIKNKYLEVGIEGSALNSQISKLLISTVQWSSECGAENEDLFEVVRILFLKFTDQGLSYLNDKQESVIAYLKNTLAQNNDKVFHQRFCSELSKLLESAGQSTKVLFKCSESFTISTELSEVFEEVWPVCRGCEARCPYCNQKCSGTKDVHISHYCDNHLMQAFRGWRNKSGDPDLKICTEPMNFQESYAIYETDIAGFRHWTSEYIPFAEHTRRLHPDWKIVPVSKSEDIHESEKAAWLVLRDRLAEKFNYKTTTPSEWEILYRGRANRTKSIQIKIQ